MSDQNNNSINRAASVNMFLEPLQTWMDNPAITEICINRPGEVWFESQSKWDKAALTAITLDHLRSLATAVAKFSNDDISDMKPILSATLPKGERIQIVMAPACEKSTYSVTIRKPSHEVRSLSSYDEQGFFQHIKPIIAELSKDEEKLLELKNSNKIEEFLRLAVKLEKVIVIAGETGSGKTTLMKGLMQEIPENQRIVTIEDVPELFLPKHPNHVHLFYKSEAKEDDAVNAATLLKSCLRMKPDRILLAELRGAETFDFVNVVSSGHGGSITSLHAGSAELAFERMALMILQNPQGRMLPYPVIRRLLYMVVDVVLHVHNDTYSGTGRHITELWYEPTRKREKFS